MIIIALAYSISVHSQTNPEADGLFGDENEVGVIVVLKDDYGAFQKYSIKNSKSPYNRILLNREGI